MSNPEHLSWIKLGQKIIGALLWLSTRTRPDLSCAVSLVSQALFKDLKKLKDRLRHLLQYLKSTKNLGLSYPFPKGASNKFSLTEFTVYTDSSFAPAGKQSQTGIAVFLTYGTVRHLIHWQSGKEKNMAESSAESELYALSTGHKVGRNFRLMVHETLADDILLNLRCDNEATIAMLDNPSWRTRYLSIYGPSSRLRGNDPPGSQVGECHPDIRRHKPPTSRCVDKANISSSERQDLPALGIDPQRIHEWLPGKGESQA